MKPALSERSASILAISKSTIKKQRTLGFDHPWWKTVPEKIQVSQGATKKTRPQRERVHKPEQVKTYKISFSIIRERE